MVFLRLFHAGRNCWIHHCCLQQPGSNSKKILYYMINCIVVYGIMESLVDKITSSDGIFISYEKMCNSSRCPIEDSIVTGHDMNGRQIKKEIFCFHNQYMYGAVGFLELLMEMTKLGQRRSFHAW